MEERPVMAAPSPSTAVLSTAAPPDPPASAGHAFPPSPPSSCGDQSPPPAKVSLPVSFPALPPSPPGPSKPPPPPPAPSSLPFSIENILRPDFCSCDRRSTSSGSAFTPLSPEVVLRTPPKTPELPRTLSDTPVDLSHKRPVAPPKPLAVDTPPQDPASLGPSKELQASASSRTRYPDNPEELANPRVPQDDMVWPAWVYCTRYSDRPSSGPRSRRMKRRDRNPEEKRPRTAFTSEQLSRLKVEFEENKYLTEKRRQELAKDLGLNESQIKIWFQNKRAKIKKATGPKNGLAQHLMAQGLYNHSTMPVDEDDPYLN